MKRPSLFTRAAGWRFWRSRKKARNSPTRLVSRLRRLSRAFSQHACLETNTLRLPVPSWKQEATLRLAVVADLHVAPHMGDYLDDIVQRVIDAQPDAILFLGDLMNGHGEHESMPLDEIAAHLAPWSQYPLFGVLGNHDYWYDATAVEHMLENQLSMRMLEGENACLRLEGKPPVYLGGVRCLYTFQKKPGKLPNLPAEAKASGAPYIFLSHTPSGAFVAPEGTLITLAGHSHGGQICLPRGRVIKSSESRVARKLSRGFHPAQKGRSALYTSRGLGTSVVSLRLFCKPELFFLELCEFDKASLLV